LPESIISLTRQGCTFRVMLDKPGQKGCAVDFGGEPGGMVCSVGGGIEGKSIQARVRGRVKSSQAK